MKVLLATAVLGAALMGSLGAVSAQPYGGSDYGYRDGYRGRDDGYRGRDDGYRGGYRGRGDDYDDRRSRGREYGFDEREYLRCNPDVRRAVANGQMESGAAHYKVFGRRENRRLSC